jgi:hypothetical protein
VPSVLDSSSDAAKAASLKNRTGQRLKPRPRMPLNIPCCGGIANIGLETCDGSIANLTTLRCDCPVQASFNCALLGLVLKGIDSTWIKNAEWNLKSKQNQADLLPASKYWPFAVATLNTMLSESEITYRVRSQQTLRAYYDTLIRIEQPDVMDRLYSTPFYESLRGLQSKISPGSAAVREAKTAKASATPATSSSSLVRASNSGLLVDPSTVALEKGSSSSGTASPVARPAKKPRVVESNPTAKSLLTFDLKSRLKIVDQEIAHYEAEGDADMVQGLKKARTKLVLELFDI